MITNSFHKNNNLIGINIEKTDGNSFVICVAYKINEKWKSKTISGISGDWDNETLINQVIAQGQSMDRKTAMLIFSNASLNSADYLED